MCVKLPLGDLNLGSCPPHPTSTYTCGVTIAPKVRGGLSNFNYQITLTNKLNTNTFIFSKDN